ncbi:MAG TPA: 50S ribosomal protein L25 [Candidatus Limnocylindrales bacterium]|nr:50S ribosomal protein L25 [Candidatus Limnocylindrales bacterium]
MSTARPTLSATHRSVTGKKVAALRRDGLLPAVVYGHGVESNSLAIDARDFESLRRHAGANALIDLSIEGGTSTPVLVHAVQQHPVTRRPLHVDLLQVRMTEDLTIDVPLISEGASRAVDDLGGTLLHVIEHVRVRARPDNLPQSFHYAIDGLASFDDQIHVGDLSIPEGVTLLTDPGEVIAKVLPPRVEEVEEPTAEAEEGAEAAAEGAEQPEATPAEESSTEG